MPPFLLTLGDITRRLVPFISTFLLLVISFVKFPVPYLGQVMPPLALMGVFYWAIHRPDRFGIVAAFMIGLFQDLLMGAPLGVTAFLYALTHHLLWPQQRFFKGAPFWLLWVVFAATQALVSFAQWAFWSAFGETIYPIFPFMVQLFLAILFFPPIQWVLNRLHSHYLKQII